MLRRDDSFDGEIVVEGIEAYSSKRASLQVVVNSLEDMKCAWRRWPRVLGKADVCLLGRMYP